MPLSSQQMATLVQRARAKAPPIPAAEPIPPRPRQAATTAPPAARLRSMPAQAPAPAVTPPPPAKAGPVAEPATMPAEPDDFPTGWELKKESWHFHRRFYRVLRRPMRQGEYSYLLRQIWQHRGEHLGEHYWRVTLPDDRTTLVVTATRWRLITILPKGWQPTPAGGLSPPATQTGAVPPS